MSADSDQTRASKLLRAATRASVCVAIVLAGAKTMAWWFTGSVVVFASLLDSLMDLAASLINLFAVDYSLKPADRDHRFGHGKAEALAGLGQSIFITVSAGVVLYHAFDRIITPQQVANVEGAIWVIVFAVIVTTALVLLQKYVISKTGSTAVQADSIHYQADLLTNVATLAALFLTQSGVVRADGFFALLIALYILYSAVRVGWGAVRILMDEELPDEERADILACVESTGGVEGVDQLRTWRSGQRRVIHLDVQFKGSRSLLDIYENSNLVRQRLLEKDPLADVSIHPVPSSE